MKTEMTRTNAEVKKMTWSELSDYIYAYNARHDNHYNHIKKRLVAAVVFSNDSPGWDKEYSLEDRTYKFGNGEKYWYGECGGSSLFALCPAESGLVRLDWYLPEWVVEYCYIVSEED
jgi:hypothetical protein